jgi:hypothetical protein
MRERRPSLASVDATLHRIDAVLAELEPGSPWAGWRAWESARWRIGTQQPSFVWTSSDVAAAAAAKPADGDRVVLGYDAACRPADALVAFALARFAYGPVVAKTPGFVVTVPPARKYIAPPAESRPRWLGWIRRRLFGEPPQ